MQEFAEQYIEDLKPRDTRYDTRLGDDFYISTFPNGIKTWIYVYNINGYQRRKTLGVYPEMSLADAREALFSSRKLQQLEEDLIAQGMAGEVVRQAEAATAKTHQPDTARRRGLLDRRLLSGIAAGVLMSVAAVLVYSRLVHTDHPARIAAAGPVQPERAPPDRVSADTPAGEPDEPLEASAPEAQRLAAIVDAAQGTPPEPGADPAATGHSPRPASLRMTRVVDALRGTVAREVLTRAGTGSEAPVEVDDAPVAFEPGEERRLHYFTEVRGMTGERFSHRWTHEGEVFEETPLYVGEGWRYMLQSSAEIPASLAGRWTVELVGPDGRTVESLVFHVAPDDDAARLATSADD